MLFQLGFKTKKQGFPVPFDTIVNILKSKEAAWQLVRSYNSVVAGDLRIEDNNEFAVIRVIRDLNKKFEDKNYFFTMQENTDFLCVNHKSVSYFLPDERMPLSDYKEIQDVLKENNIKFNIIGQVIYGNNAEDLLNLGRALIDLNIYPGEETEAFVYEF